MGNNKTMVMIIVVAVFSLGTLFFINQSLSRKITHLQRADKNLMTSPMQTQVKKTSRARPPLIDPLNDPLAPVTPRVDNQPIRNYSPKSKRVTSPIRESAVKSTILIQ